MTQAQSVWVYFTDKCDTNQDYFKSEVCPDYIEDLQKRNVSIQGTSKWLNAACIDSKYVDIAKDLPYVARIEQLGSYRVKEEQIAEDFEYGNSDWQIEMMQIHTYHQMGFTGKGVRLAIFDAGFFKVDSLPVFDSLWANNQIKETRDFVTNDTLTYRESSHGMQVLALAGINYPDSMVGTAPGADFILVRTEQAGTEKHIEELNWLRAMEWADSIGVDIIHSSLGYSLFDSLEGDYTYQDMDGQSTLITLAAQKAASLGIFITNSAGNSGDDPWFYITAPCDGKDVLCIGAVDSFEVVTDFSSRGPSSDGRIKPDVTAMGRRNTIPDVDGILRTGSGTSFSGPLVAGLVACLKGAHTDKTNAQIFEAILRSADRYNTPDNEYGHGIPNAIKADSILKDMPILGVSNIKELEVSIYPNPANDYLKVQCDPGASYRLTNIQGQLIQSGRLNNWINFVKVDNVESGSYFIQVLFEGKTATNKILVQ